MYGEYGISIRTYNTAYIANLLLKQYSLDEIRRTTNEYGYSPSLII